MKNWLRKYWIELLVFGAILGVFLLCCAPDMTWVNTDSDGIHYTYAAENLYPAHKTSAPLFLLLGNLFLKIPFGTEFWRFALLSVFASTASVIFIYLIIKELLYKKLIEKPKGREYTFLTKEKFLADYRELKSHKTYALIGALIFGGSALVISQSTIVETYALVTMLGLGAYYFAIKEKWLPCALMLGAGTATHHLIFIPLIILFIAYKGLRQWRYVGITASFLLLYLYVPITAAINNPPDMWGNTTVGGFLGDSATTALMLAGGLSIWDLPKRIFDALGILGVSLGLAIIPVGYYCFAKHTIPNPMRKQWYREPLLWLFALPIIYYIVDLAPQTYVYMLPAIGFGAVIAGVALARMRHYWKYIVLGCAILLLAFNANYFDIGRTLDPDMSATEYYVEELDKVPDGEVLMPSHDWEWAAIIPYNKANDRNIIPICIGVLPSTEYQESLAKLGVEIDYTKAIVPVYLSIGLIEANPSQTSSFLANYIIEMNDNVWTTHTTDASTYGVEIVLAEENGIYFDIPPSEVDPEWQWIPYNPYDIITGAVEVEGWVNILQSNYSMLTFFMLATIGIIPAWIIYTVLIKKKKWNPRHNKKATTDV